MNEERIKEIEKQISLLQKEKERLEYEDSIPEIEHKISDYLSRTTDRLWQFYSLK